VGQLRQHRQRCDRAAAVQAGQGGADLVRELTEHVFQVLALQMGGVVVELAG
jgi:hypothetical protein